MKELSSPAYNMTQIVGTSPTSWDDAIQNGLKEASTTLNQMHWIQVDEFRGAVGQDGSLSQYQIVFRIGSEASQ